MNKQKWGMLLASLFVSACANTPANQVVTSPLYLPGEGRPVDSLDDMMAIEHVPDAIPQVEPLHAFANRPYTVYGQTYTPLSNPVGFVERGLASWYGTGFEGKTTASGDPYGLYVMAAAHPILPIPSYARVTNLETGKSIIVRINDRGPFIDNRIINLSYVAARKLDIVGTGTVEVEVESVLPDAVAPPRLDHHHRTTPLFTIQSK